jgi:hypothetical protein
MHAANLSCYWTVIVTVAFIVLPYSTIYADESGDEEFDPFAFDVEFEVQADESDGKSIETHEQISPPKAIKVFPQPVVHKGRVIDGLPLPRAFSLSEVFGRNLWVMEDAEASKGEFRLIEIDQEEKLLGFSLTSTEAELKYSGIGFEISLLDEFLLLDRNEEPWKLGITLIKRISRDDFEFTVSLIESGETVTRNLSEVDTLKSPESDFDFLVLESFILQTALDTYWLSHDPASVVESSNRLLDYLSAFDNSDELRNEIGVLQEIFSDATLLADARRNRLASQPEKKMSK